MLIECQKRRIFSLLRLDKNKPKSAQMLEVIDFVDDDLRVVGNEVIFEPLAKN
jgi:hypothetical protein